MTRPAYAVIRLAHLRHNFRKICELAGDAEIMAIVKANAYGHGLQAVARALAEEGCRHFGVTDAEEGVRLRSELPQPASITLLSGVFDRRDAELAARHRLLPAVFAKEQVQWLQRAGFDHQVWLKVDTGMGRLGNEAPLQLLQACDAAGIGVRGLLSHLACADEPEHPLNRLQYERFAQLCDRFGLPGSLLNSAGLINLPEGRFSCVRPGIALYGCEPVPSRPLGLRPVMELRGRIIQERNLPSNHPVSYGATFRTRMPTRIGVVALGYGDGVPRGLSNCGEVVVHERRHAILGRICMDYSIIALDDSPARTGDWAEFWGDGISAQEVADRLGSIPYELFTGISSRVHRQAVE